MTVASMVDELGSLFDKTSDAFAAALPDAAAAVEEEPPWSAELPWSGCSFASWLELLRPWNVAMPCTSNLWKPSGSHSCTWRREPGAGDTAGAEDHTVCCARSGVSCGGTIEDGNGDDDDGFDNDGDKTH